MTRKLQGFLLWQARLQGTIKNFRVAAKATLIALDTRLGAVRILESESSHSTTLIKEFICLS